MPEDELASAEDADDGELDPERGGDRNEEAQDQRRGWRWSRRVGRVVSPRVHRRGALDGKAPHAQGAAGVGAGEDVGARAAGQPSAGHAPQGTHGAPLVDDHETGPGRSLLGDEGTIAAVRPVHEAGDRESGDGPAVRLDDESVPWLARRVRGVQGGGQEHAAPEPLGHLEGDWRPDRSGGAVDHAGAGAI